MKANLLDRFFLGSIIVLAALLLLAGSWFSYTSTFDTGTVGLMSVNIVHGDRPLFFYGQPYFGALEAYLAAMFICLFGFSEFVVSLSPITFTLAWIVFSYLLFSRIHNRTAGLIAAACAAFPGYYVFWYSIATYGGYSVILCVGTAMLWLSLRVLQENVQKTSLALHAACIGILMGVGIWVHPLSFPYIAIAACILGIFALRERFRVDIVLSLMGAAIVGLTGFVPFYFETGSFLGGVSESVQISWTGVIKALSNLFGTNIFDLLVWNFIQTIEIPIVRYLVVYGSLSLLCMALLLALYSLTGKKNRQLQKINYLIPSSYCLLFLMMYVQHHMATIKAPRYAINFLCMLLCMLWSLAIAGQTKRVLKITASVLFCIWLGYQIVGTVLFIAGNTDNARSEQQLARDIVSAARAHNLKSVVTYGDSYFGLKGQKFSMYSQNMIAFTHADTERYQPNAQFSETDLNRGYLSTVNSKISLKNTLKELGVGFTVEQIHEYFLFSNLHSRPQVAMQAIPSEEIQLVSSDNAKNDMAGELLQDRSQDIGTDLNTIADMTLSFDTGKVRKLCALWMFIYQDPAANMWKGPGRYEVHVSRDGIRYDKIYSSLPETGNGFHAGPGIYIGGPWGKVESLFSPVYARYVRVLFLEKSSSPITELFIFQTDGSLRQDAPDDIAQLTQLIVDQNLDFVLADRWLSARLREVFKGGSKKEIALARHSTKYKNNPLRYFVRPSRGQALICDTAVADECEKVLIKQYGQSVISKRFDVHNYSLFALAEAEIRLDLINPSALLWNGHFPLQTKDMSLLAPWFNNVGLPVWRADFTKTRGVYRDSWTNGDARFYDLGYTIQRGKDQELVLYTHGWRPDKEMSSLKLTLTANNKILLPFKKTEQNVYIFSIPDTLTRLKSLAIESTTFVPSSKDSRKLGIDINRIEIQ
ncbi:MAG: glycosyltransferase family 39 protein [Proteobacteria bacterium]|nr:glycosyltransferase family 39 protein [Pseudomonadota bacterium]MBU1650471.1 glycosyltransferase family 39 protein [Pseudomonadota bacterium]